MAESEQPRGERFHELLNRRAEHLRALLEETEKRRREAESNGLSFTAPTPEQLEEKLPAGHGAPGSRPCLRETTREW
jgi:hypothetical protein